MYVIDILPANIIDDVTSETTLEQKPSQFPIPPICRNCLSSTNMAPKSILSVNAGSSSVKLTFYTFEKTPKEIANAQISGITAPPQTLKYTCGSNTHKETLDEKLGTPQAAFKSLLQRCLSDPALSEVASTDDLAYICHRVVHGGDYDRAVMIDDETYHKLEELEDLAPLYVDKPSPCEERLD